MSSESRLSNSIKNVRVAWIWQIVYIFFKFFTRRYFAMYIGAEYLGIEGLFTSIMGIMNLAELGLGTAIGFALYRPLAEKNEQAIQSIMQLMARVYRFLALYIFIGGMIIMPFITVISPESKNLDYVHTIFGFYIASTCCSYLFAYKSVLTNSDQKNYVYLRNHYIFTISMNIVQIFILVTTKSYILYAFVQCVFVIAEGISISMQVNRRYPFIRNREITPISQGFKASIIANVKRIAFGKIGGNIINSTDSLVLANVVGLASTGIYNNYYLVMISLQAIVAQLPSAFSASIGNVVARGEKDTEKDVFWKLMFTNTSLYGITVTCLFNLVQPFVGYWVGGNYLLDIHTTVAIMGIYFLTGLRCQLGPFSYAHGAFKIEPPKAILEAVTNLGLSIVLAMKFGTLGVVLGTVISSACIGLPMEVYNVHTVLDFSVRRYIGKLAAYTGVTAVVMAISYYLCSLVSMHWYIRIPVGGLISVAVFGVFWIACFGRTREFKEVLGIAKGLLKR